MGGSTLPLTPDAFSGRKLGKYEVLCRLSTGGMAEIFLASQRGLAGFRKLVVLKQILPDIAGEEEFVQMFLDEAKVTAAFNHPHIAMEFVPGATLVEVAKACRSSGEPIPIGFSLEAVRDTALALHYAHTFTDPLGRPSPVIHRDVAEKNIMVTYEGVTKLLDFGIAKSLARKGRTQVGMVKGTSGYMSPEQILGEPLDARSDLFSLGVVLHELLTGMRLFHAKTPQAGASAVLHGQIPPPSRINKAIPPELDAVVLKALERRREERFSTTLEFARALERAVGPLFWHPEQSAELIQRLFSERREQTRQLLVAERAASGESTGVVNVAKILSPATLPEAPALPPEPGTVPSQPSLPQITSQLPPPRLSATGVPAVKTPAPEASHSKPPTPRPSYAGLPAVKPPPPPPHEETQAKPPTPPRGAPSRRSGTSTALPSSPPAEPAGVRRAIFEPLPQKRAATTLPEAMPPAPPPQETTARTQPGDNRLSGRTPVWNPPESGTRTAPLEKPFPTTGEQTLSDNVEVNTRPEELPPSELGTRPMRVDLPSGEAPAPLRSLPAEDEHTTDGRNSREVKTTLARTVSKSSSERVALPPAGSASARPPRRREPTPPPMEMEEPSPSDVDEEYAQPRSQEEFSQPPSRREEPFTQPPSQEEEEFSQPEFQTEFTTRPVHAVQFDEPEDPHPDTNEIYVPDVEEGPTMVSLPSVETLRKRQEQGKRGGWMIVVLGLGVLLLGGLGAAIALGLDGGRLMGMVSPPAPPSEERGKLTPIQDPRTRPAPAAQPSAPTRTPAAPEAAPPSTPAASPEATPPAKAAPAPEPSGAAANPATPPLAAEPEAKPEGDTSDKSVEALTLPEVEPAPAAKKARPSTSAPAVSGGGTLTLVTNPYAKVYLGRRLLGGTPLFKLPVPAGKHSLKLVREDGRTVRVPVEIKTGETTALKLALDELTQE
jgi:serine/threonine protein kinase